MSVWTWQFPEDSYDGPIFSNYPPAVCLYHDPVDTGFKRSWCKSCDADLYMAENGSYEEVTRDGCKEG